MAKGRPKGSKTKVSQSQKQNSKVGNIHININSGTRTRKRNNVQHQQQHQVYQPAPNYSSAQTSGHQYNSNVDFIPVNTPTITNENSDIKNIMSEIMGRITNVKPEGNQTVINNYGTQMEPKKPDEVITNDGTVVNNIIPEANDEEHPLATAASNIVQGAVATAGGVAILGSGGYGYRKGIKPAANFIGKKAEPGARIIGKKIAKLPGKFGAIGGAIGSTVGDAVGSLFRGVGNRLGGSGATSNLTKKVNGNTYAQFEDALSPEMVRSPSIVSNSSNDGTLNQLSRMVGLTPSRPPKPSNEEVKQIVKQIQQPTPSKTPLKPLPRATDFSRASTMSPGRQINFNQVEFDAHIAKHSPPPSVARRVSGSMYDRQSNLRPITRSQTLADQAATRIQKHIKGRIIRKPFDRAAERAIALEEATFAQARAEALLTPTDAVPARGTPGRRLPATPTRPRPTPTRPPPPSTINPPPTVPPDPTAPHPPGQRLKKNGEPAKKPGPRPKDK